MAVSDIKNLAAAAGWSDKRLSDAIRAWVFADESRAQDFLLHMLSIVTYERPLTGKEVADAVQAMRPANVIDFPRRDK